MIKSAHPVRPPYLDRADAPPPGKSRREFIAGLVMNLGAVFGLGALAARFGSYLYPVIPPPKVVEIPAGKRSAVPKAGAVQFGLPGLKQVIVVETEKGLRGFSPVCTHLGCIVRWHADKKQFICPCHKGTFDMEGKVVAGPPPRPLDEVQLVVRGDDILVVVQTREENV